MRSRLLLDSFSSEMVYHHKKDLQGAASLNQTVLESSDKTNPNLTRVLDVNPSLFLAREVQTLLIYLRGEGRLNNTQSNNQSTYYPSFTSLPCSFSLVLRSFFVLKDSDPRGSRGGRTDLEQPIAAARPDGVPPGRAGFRVFKSAHRIACVPRFRPGLFRRELRCITLGVGGTR